VQRTVRLASYFSLVDNVTNLVDSLVPTAVTPVTMTMAIKAAIRPYSMAVAADSSAKNSQQIHRKPPSSRHDRESSRVVELFQINLLNEALTD
jgi:hypothetical protein